LDAEIEASCFGRDAAFGADKDGSGVPFPVDDEVVAALEDSDSLGFGDRVPIFDEELTCLGGDDGRTVPLGENTSVERMWKPQLTSFISLSFSRRST
jgi:hypothetical protein